MAECDTVNSTDKNSVACASIDKELLELFDVLTQYQHIRGSANQELKQAYFDLTLAKRSAGYRWISPDLYSGRAQAIATAAIDPRTGHVSIVRRDVARRRTSEKSSQEQQKEMGDEGQGRSGLRQRRERKGSANKDKDKEEPGEQNNGESDEMRALDDPLLWFGMLVPPSLKDAQRGFVTSLDRLIALGQVKQQLLVKQQRLQQRIAQTQQKKQEQGMKK
ncbi:hypothetical protein LPJ64_002083 [Coemansia asiatica]|uniref:Vacuolar ATPase assembly protein VMA22 n=1 Tax=Coemansia asiatica TaxID=1052880 RepID=A0A9W7XMR8_9FUNG|nr:hypothetical protein LPJ64_002083 [Coemansia asiatica]KAJ2888591.1 hypothetical protein FB639_000535 [Coemansia asiatica]